MNHKWCPPKFGAPRKKSGRQNNNEQFFTTGSNCGTQYLMWGRKLHWLLPMWGKIGEQSKRPEGLWMLNNFVALRSFSFQAGLKRRMCFVKTRLKWKVYKFVVLIAIVDVVILVVVILVVRVVTILVVVTQWLLCVVVLVVIILVVVVVVIVVVVIVVDVAMILAMWWCVSGLGTSLWM